MYAPYLTELKRDEDVRNCAKLLNNSEKDGMLSEEDRHLVVKTYNSINKDLVTIQVPFEM